MRITRIIQQTKQKDRYSIFVDQKYSFSLSQSALLEGKLAVNQNLSQSELKAWKLRSVDDKIDSRALRYAALRPRSYWQVEIYLQRKGASTALTEKILDKLSRIGLLNDQAFALSWLTNRQLLRPTSKRKIQQALRAKHISEEIINSTLETDSQSEILVLKQMIARMRRQPSYRVDNLKLMRYLARQGFDYGDIKDALDLDE